ncbi:MAG: hypothetical protein U1U88_001779 [Lawsonella clevelandensis]
MFHYVLDAVRCRFTSFPHLQQCPFVVRAGHGGLVAARRRGWATLYN